MLMCKLVDDEDPDSQALTKEIVELAEEKVCHHLHGSETRIYARDAGGGSKAYVDAMGISANFAGVDAAIAACARPWRSNLCAVQRFIGGHKNNTGHGVSLSRLKAPAAGTKAGSLVRSKGASHPAASAAQGASKAATCGGLATRQGSHGGLQTSLAGGLGGSRGELGPSTTSDVASDPGDMQGSLPAHVRTVLPCLATIMQEDGNGKVTSVPGI